MGKRNPIVKWYILVYKFHGEILRLQGGKGWKHVAFFEKSLVDSSSLFNSNWIKFLENDSSKVSSNLVTDVPCYTSTFNA